MIKKDQMDTIEIAGQCREALDYAIEHIKMMGEIDQLSFDENKRGYKNHVQVKKQNHNFYIAWDKIYTRLPLFIFQCHLSTFDVFDDFYNELTLIFGEHTPKILLSKLTRLDVCVDILLPFDVFRNSVSVKGARVSSEMRSHGGQTLYIGKRPRLIRIYQKIKNSNKFDWAPDNSNKNNDELVCGTRVEISFSGKHIPIDSLNFLAWLAYLNPFSIIRLHNPNYNLIQNIESSRTRNLIQSYLYRLEKVGANEARKEFNMNGNFDRTIGRFLIHNTEIPLDEVFLKRVRYFFKTLFPNLEEDIDFTENTSL